VCVFYYCRTYYKAEGQKDTALGGLEDSREAETSIVSCLLASK